MGPASYEIDPSSSPDVRVARASASLNLWWHEQHVFVLDADLDRFVAVSLPPDTRPSGLSPDGTRIVVTANRLGSDNAGLYDLATGRVDWYGEETDNSSHAAALSPDGCDGRVRPAGTVVGGPSRCHRTLRCGDAWA